MSIPSRNEPEVKTAAGRRRQHSGVGFHVGTHTTGLPGRAPNLVHRDRGSAFLAVMLLLTFVLIVCWAISMQSG
jgi:hypothetical protein